MALLKRSEVPTELTWDLTHLFADDKHYESALSEVIKDGHQFVSQYRDKIDSLDRDGLNTMLDVYNDLIRDLRRISSYANLALDVDHTDQEAGRRRLKIAKVATELQTSLSFLTSDLLALDDSKLAELSAGSYGAYIDFMRRRKPYRFSAETERVLEGMSFLHNLPYLAYEAAKLGDLEFPAFEVDGKEYPLSYSLYETVYAESPDTNVRRKAYEVFYDRIASQRQTLASLYFTEVLSQKSISDMRGHDSVFQMLLLSQNVSRDLYDRQIDGLMRDLAPVMRRYAKKLQANYGLDRLTYADLRLPATPDEREVSVAEAWEVVEASVAVMGEDYQALIRQAKEERWVDFAQNIGKSTGGFCASVPDAPSYILLNWNGGFSEVFTLAHELGHAVQGKLAERHNKMLQAHPSLYFIEAPSTIHELLLTNYLLAKDDRPETARLVAGQMVAKTYFHNCVTHLLEAAFQRDVYRAIESGESLSADDFDRLFLNVLKAFWGDEVEIPQSAGRTWMRQPHYYRGLYPYTYSAGLVVSTAVAKAIREEGQPAVDRWIETLKKGGSLSPVELARIAGVDLTTDGPLQTMVETISELVDLI